MVPTWQIFNSFAVGSGGMDVPPAPHCKIKLFTGYFLYIFN